MPASARVAPSREIRRADLDWLQRRLREHYGPQGWWPAAGPLEVIAGAILVQHTAWTNARRALDNLIAAARLTPEALRTTPEAELAALLRPSGSYNSKARSLRAFAQMLATEAGGDLDALLAKPLDELRALLLATHGIGPETADAVCLFAARRPTFAVDAFTRRLLERLGWIPPKLPYERLRALFMGALAPDPARFGEYHALIVVHGKRTCRRQPRCGECPLLHRCATGRSETGAARPRRLAPQPLDWSALRQQ